MGIERQRDGVAEAELTFETDADVAAIALVTRTRRRVRTEPGGDSRLGIEICRREGLLPGSALMSTHVEGLGCRPKSRLARTSNYRPSEGRRGEWPWAPAKTADLAAMVFL